MKNNDLIRDFIQWGATKGKGSNLHIEGNKLINWTTCIAYRKGDKIFLNGKKYSTSTSVHQNFMRRNFHCIVEIETEEEFNNLVSKFERGEE